MIDDVQHLLALSTSEAVNTLFRVSHEGKTRIVRRNRVVSQRQEILPLQRRSILKLIKKVVQIPSSYFLVNESRRLIFQVFIDDNIKFRKQNQIVFFLYFGKFILDFLIYPKRKQSVKYFFFFLYQDIIADELSPIFHQMAEDVKNILLFLF